MPKVIVTHNVADVATWLGHHDERAAAIGQLGGTNVVDHVTQDGSTVVAVSADVADVGPFVETLGSPPPEMGEVMASHGVQPPLTIFVEG
jgi:hypothetical protein